jgi:hypothetical protein
VKPLDDWNEEAFRESPEYKASFACARDQVAREFYLLDKAVRENLRHDFGWMYRVLDVLAKLLAKLPRREA